MHISTEAERIGSIARPLQQVTVRGIEGRTLAVLDGHGREYLRCPAADGTVRFYVSGATGNHTLLALDEAGRICSRNSLEVKASTHIRDAQGNYSRLLDVLHDTMFRNYAHYIRIEGKLYRYYVTWLRDHVHVLKGMKWFDEGDIKSGIELYADSQREDGMIWDKCKEMAHSELQFWRDYEFAEGDFIRKIPGNPTRRWQRVPVENDVEYLFIEGLYYTWKACGDDEWMKGLLDNALAAVRYSTTDRYRWSEKFGLLKRGYTIDTWDFQHSDDAARSGSVMRVHPERTEFGIMFGDNTGMIASCRCLAEMLRVAERVVEAREMDELADTLQVRLDDLAWTGRHYRHHVPENPDAERDVGDTDEAAQVCQSNAYSLNRGITPQQRHAIIQTYRRIRRERPETSAGEFYSIYPPFEKGFRQNKWDYMNGGVTAICAGELARGAFENGFERYGVEILEKILEWGEYFDGYLPTCMKGAIPERPPTKFTTVDLRGAANVDFCGDGAEGVPGWSGEGKNDLSRMPVGKQTFEGVEFDIIDPAVNNRRAVLGLSSEEPYAGGAVVEVDSTAQSIYLVHTVTKAEPLAGWFILQYEDGTHHTEYVRLGRHVEPWFMPAPNSARIKKESKSAAPLRVAWQGPNDIFENVGVFVYGWDNPQPAEKIKKIAFHAADNGAKWFICALTLSDRPAFFTPSPLSYGIPDAWGAAAVVYAMVEGLAGVIDGGVALDRAAVTPRWAAAGESAADVCIHYPASGGYVAYRWETTPNGQKLMLAGSGREMNVRLPVDGEPAAVTLNGSDVRHVMERSGESLYAAVHVEGAGAHVIEVRTE